MLSFLPAFGLHRGVFSKSAIKLLFAAAWLLCPLHVSAHKVTSHRVVSPGQGYLDVTVRAGGTLWPHAPVRSRALELFDLSAEPVVLSGLSGETTLSVQGTVDPGGFETRPYGHYRHVVRGEFNIVDPHTCREIRELSFEMPALAPSAFSPSVTWDGRDRHGRPLDGFYFYRALTRLTGELGAYRATEDYLATAYQVIAVDSTPPVVFIDAPTQNGIFAINAVDISATWDDPRVHHFASGLDLASGQVTLDGIDVTGLVTIDLDGVTGTITGIQDGAHTLTISVQDQVGNYSEQREDFVVDTTPPTITWSQPPPITGDAEVPIEITFSDPSSGLVYTSISLEANELLLTGVLNCSPSGPDGVAQTVCTGTYPLDEGAWLFHAVVTDRAGNIGTASTEALVDRSPPTITLDPNPDASVVTTDVVPILGRVSDATSVTMQINNQGVAMVGNAFSAQVPLIVGANPITLIATDALGHATTLVVTVTRKLKGPEVTSLSLNGVAIPCADPAPDAVVAVDSTMSPRLEVRYRDVTAGVFGDGVRVLVDGLEMGCTGTSGDRSAGLSCPLAMSAGSHSLQLMVPDRTLANTTVCAVHVDIDAIVVQAAPNSAVAGALVQVPSALGIVPAISEGASGTAVPAGLAPAGPTVDLQAGVDELPSGSTMLVTLPYTLSSLAEGFDEDVRAYRLDPVGWVMEPATQWVVNTLTRTITYTTNHFSLRAAMVSSRPLVASVPTAAVLDNGRSANGDKRILLVDSQHLSPLGVLRKLELPSPPIATLQTLLGGVTLNTSDITLGSFYVKSIRAIATNKLVVHMRAIWVVHPTDDHIGLTLDQDELWALSVTSDVIWKVALAGTDATTDTWTPCSAPASGAEDCSSGAPAYRHVQQTIRDFALSADAQRLYLIGDTSLGDRTSRGDGIYLISVPSLTPGTLYQATTVSTPLVVGESATLAVSGYWGPDRIFVAGSGPRNWRSDQAYVSLAASQARELQATVVSGPLQTLTFTAGGPYGMYEFTPLQDLVAADNESPCPESLMQISSGYMYNAPRNTWLTRGPSVFDDLTNVSRRLASSFAAQCDLSLLSVDDPSKADPIAWASTGERGRALAALNLGARNVVAGDLMSNMLEAGQVAVFDLTNNRVTRVGTIPLVDEPDFTTANQHAYFRAALSDPVASLGVSRDGVLWVRTTELSSGTVPCEQRPYACPAGTDPGLISFTGSLSVKPMLVATDCSMSPSSPCLSTSFRAAQALVPDGSAPTVGRTALSVSGTEWSPIVVDQNGQVSKFDWIYSGGGTSLFSSSIGSLPGPLASDNRYLSAAAELGYADPINKTGRLIMVAATYDDDDPSNDTALCGGGVHCHAPESLLAGFSAQADGTYVASFLSGARGDFSFSAYAQMPKTAAVLLAPTPVLLENFILPRPLMSRLAPNGAVMGTDVTFHDLREPAIGQVKINVRYLVPENGGSSFSSATIDLPALQQLIDDSSLGMSPRSTLALRVFVADTQGSEVVLWPSSLKIASTGDSSPTTLVRPQPVLAANGLPDPELSFFIVADANAPLGVSVVAECEDADTSLFGSVIRYGEAGYLGPAPTEIEPCNDGDVQAICLSAMPLRNAPDTVQVVYADLAVCGAASSYLNADKARQQSLASDPLKAVIGAVQCVNANTCASGLCADGFCCDRVCDSCEACSRNAGGSTDGTCTVAQAGTVCDGVQSGCVIPALCDGESASCPSDQPAPGAEELCNLQDDNCNGLVDDGCVMAVTSGSTTASFNPAPVFGYALDQFGSNSSFTPPRAETAPVGATDGTFDVLSDGSASYTIPIIVPPGRAGIQPSLALRYNSRGVNGALGVGWSIAGLSEIRRCRKTVAQDGLVAAPTADTDALCLDGNRLMAQNASTCGANTVEYRTEIDTFARVCAFSGTYGPAYFSVWSKDGRISEYGCSPHNTTPGLCTATDNERPIAWPLVKVSDRQGNTMSLAYYTARELNTDVPVANELVALGVTLPTDGSFYAIKEIRYTGNAAYGDEPMRHVYFEYEQRISDTTWDTISGFTMGAYVAMTYRLKRVAAYGPGDALVRSYELAYEPSPASGRSRITSIAECTGDGVCKPATKLAWQSQQSATWAQTGTGELESQTVPSRAAPALLADLDNDGVGELLLPENTRPVVDFIGGASRTLAAAFSGSSAPVSMDADSDGFVDVLTFEIAYATSEYRERSLLLRASGHESSRALEAQSTNLPLYVRGRFVGDFDGDGYTDLITAPTCNSSTPQPLMLWRGQRGALLAEGEPIGVTAPPCDGVAEPGGFVVDVDGDGADELFWFNSSQQRYVVLTHGAEYSGADFLPSDVATTRLGAVQRADVNGDGLRDLYVERDGFELLLLNDGVRFRQVGEPLFGAAYCNGGPVRAELRAAVVADFDGDGAEEMIQPVANAHAGSEQCTPGEGCCTSWSFTGGGELVQLKWREGALDISPFEIAGTYAAGSALNNVPWLFAVDINTDGAPDLVVGDARGWRVYSQQGATRDLLVSIRTGTNPGSGPANVEISYSAGTSSESYDAKVMPECNGYQYCGPLNAPLVSRVRTFMGTGVDVREVTYNYGDSRFDRRGRGWLGFKYLESHDATNGIDTYRTFDVDTYSDNIRDYPYRRIAISEAEVYRTGSGTYTYRTATNTPALNIRGGSYFAYVQAREIKLTQRPPQNTDPYVIVDTRRVLDAFGNEQDFVEQARLGSAMGGLTSAQQQAAASVLDVARIGDSVRVHREFTNDTSAWLIGLVSSEETTVTSAYCQAQGGACPAGGETHRRRTLTYTSTGLVQTSTLEPGTREQLVTTYSYDHYGNVVRTDRVGSGTTRTEETAYEPLEHMFPWASVNAAGHRVWLIYDRQLGTLYATRDANDIASLTITDGFGRVTGSGTAGGVVTRTSYAASSRDDASMEVTTSDSTGASSVVVLDRLGREIERRSTGLNGKVSVVSRTYDALGRQASESLPREPGASVDWLDTTHDALGRVTEQQTPDGVVRYRYTGAVVVTTDARGNMHASLRDAHGQPVAVFDAEGAMTRYDYTGGALWRVTDSQGHVIEAIHDGYGKKRELRDPDLGITDYEYNAFGELTRSVNSQESVTLTLDVLGRTTRREAAYPRAGRPTEVSTFAWDTAPGAGIGRLHEEVAPDGHSETYSFDAYGRATSVVTALVHEGRSESFETSTAYDFAGRASVVTYPASEGETRPSVALRYDAHGPLAGIDALSGINVIGALWQAQGANARGQVTQESFGDGTSTSRTYFARSGRADAIITQSASGERWQSLRHEWDESGNLVARNDELQRNSRERFSYDRLNRLTQATKAGAVVQSLSYDATGNILNRSDVGAYEYNAAQPHAVTRTGADSFSYDALGRQITRTHEGHAYTTTYNTWGKPSEVQEGSAVVQALSYSAHGERVIKQTPSETTLYVGGLYERRESNGQVVEQFYVQAQGRTVAVLRRARAGAEAEPEYLHPDHLGSPVLITSAVKEPELRTYDLWGKRTDTPDASEAKGLGYTGHEDDSELGLVNMGGRVYDPSIGRFTTPDPIVQAPFFSQSLNRYSYVFNNPLSFVDPSGYEGESAGGESDGDGADGGDAYGGFSLGVSQCFGVGADGTVQSSPGPCQNTSGMGTTPSVAPGPTTSAGSSAPATAPVTGYGGPGSMPAPTTSIGWQSAVGAYLSVSPLGWISAYNDWALAKAGISDQDLQAAQVFAMSSPPPMVLDDAFVMAAIGSRTGAGWMARFARGLWGRVAAEVGAADGLAASSARNGVLLRNQLTAEEIAGGHAFEKHVVQQAAFPGVTTRGQFAGGIEDFLNSPGTISRELSNGRTAFWNDATSTVLVRNPAAPDGGTYFVPSSGINYFWGLK